MNKKYDNSIIQLVRDLSDKSIKEIMLQTGLTEKQVIYIKQHYNIYKKRNKQQ